MKAVVIGAAGHIGTYLVPMLVNGGYETTAITRTMSKPYEENPAWSKAERILLDRDHEGFIDALKALRPDIIVDLVNFSIAETKKIVDAFRDTGLTHYLYCSSCWAHGMAETIPLGQSFSARVSGHCGRQRDLFTELRTGDFASRSRL